MRGPHFDVVVAVPGRTGTTAGPDGAVRIAAFDEACATYATVARAIVGPLIAEGRRVAELRFGDARLGVEGDTVLEPDATLAVGPPALADGYRLHRWLCEQSTSTLIVPDLGGLAWAVLDARAAGYAHGHTHVVVVAVGPSARAREADGAHGLDLETAVGDALEAHALASADTVVPAHHDVRGWWARTGATPRGTVPDGLGSAAEAVAAAVRLADGASRTQQPGQPGPGEVADAARALARTGAVTAVVTHHERPTLARRAIDSLLVQSWPDLRLLVVDDGSRSAEALAFLDELEEAALPRPLTVLRKPNGGLGSARNAALAAASTDLVAFLDDDDEAEPGYIEALAGALGSTGGPSAAAVGFKVFHDVPSGPLEGRAEDLHWLFFSAAPHLAVLDNLMGGAAAMFRRADALAVGGYHEVRERGFEDWRILVELVLSGRTVVSIPEPLLRYRVSAQSMLRTFSARESQRLVLDAYRAALPEALRPWPGLLLGLHDEVAGLRAELAAVRADHDRGDRPAPAAHGPGAAGPARAGGALGAAGRRLADRGRSLLRRGAGPAPRSGR